VNWLLSRRDRLRVARHEVPGFPGTSCLATLRLSLWDEGILRAEALINLASTGGLPRASAKISSVISTHPIQL
jgi:hypothetical protein